MEKDKEVLILAKEKELEDLNMKSLLSITTKEKELLYLEGQKETLKEKLANKD